MLAKEITITPVLNGFIVKVGCRIVVLQGNAEKLGMEVQRYYESPANVEEYYLTHAVNSKPSFEEGPRINIGIGTVKAAGTTNLPPERVRPQESTKPKEI